MLQLCGYRIILVENENEAEVRKPNRKKPKNLRTKNANATALVAQLRECQINLADMCAPCFCVALFWDDFGVSLHT